MDGSTPPIPRPAATVVLVREEPAAGMDVTGAEALAVRVCALRETFEEVGWLAAEGPWRQLGRSDAEPPECFLERCLELGVRLGTERLSPTGRWVTPLGSPIRFDAHFFV